jgi:hypothetical protein
MQTQELKMKVDPVGNTVLILGSIELSNIFPSKAPTWRAAAIGA